MTNNLAEQTVKSYVINRKNFLFSDTEKGADASAAVMSIIETAKRNKLDVYGYLTHLLTVLPEWGQNPTEKLNKICRHILTKRQLSVKIKGSYYMYRGDRI